MHQIQEGERIECDTREEALMLLRIAHSQGYKWGSGDSLLEYSYWETKIGYIIYNFNARKRVTYSEFVSDRVVNFSTIFGDVNCIPKDTVINIQDEISVIKNTVEKFIRNYYASKAYQSNEEDLVNKIFELQKALDMIDDNVDIYF